MTAQKSRKKGAEWAVDPSGQLSALAEMNGKNLEAAQAAGQAAIRGLTDFSQETAEFVSTRLQKDMQAAQRLAACRSVGEAWQCQADFFGDMMTDYASQASKILHLGARSAAGAAEAAVAGLEQMPEFSQMAETGARSEMKAAAE